jgi:diguanylate cyclase (GGDEF)-like protein
MIWPGVARDALLVLVFVNILIVSIYSGDGLDRVMFEMAISSSIAVIVTLPISANRQLQHVRIRHFAEQLRRIAETDQLTDLGNRRAMMDCLNRLAVPENAAFVIFDIDRFKRINDRFGHAGGDAAIQAFASLVRDNICEGAFAARLGGEEFGVLLPDATHKEAERFALSVVEQARRLLARAPNGLPITMTVSAGFAAGLPHAERLILAADEALYRAKREGRDRVRAAA